MVCNFATELRMSVELVESDFRRGMASALECVLLPCDLPQWERIIHLLTELKDSLAVDPSPAYLVKQLNLVHHLAQNRAVPSSQDSKKEFSKNAAGDYC